MADSPWAAPAQPSTQPLPPQPRRVHIPRTTNPDGACASCCPDPTEPLCGDLGFSLADMGGNEVPCDCACFWAVLAAIALTGAGVAAAVTMRPNWDAIVGSPTTTASASSDPATAAQAALCRQAVRPSVLSGCAVAASQ